MSDEKTAPVSTANAPKSIAAQPLTSTSVVGETDVKSKGVTKGLTVLLFGATGSAGGSILQLLLESPLISAVRVIGRRSTGRTHPKLREFTHTDYVNYTAVSDAFLDVDAAIFALGMSGSQAESEAHYRRITQEYPLAAAAALREHSPQASFHYISGTGAGLDSMFMWARVKAEAERDLVARFNAVCWRPAHIDGMPSQSQPKVYRVLAPVGRLLFEAFRSLYVKGEDIGRAIVQATVHDGPQTRGHVFTNTQLRDWADQYKAEFPTPLAAPTSTATTAADKKVSASASEAKA